MKQPPTYKRYDPAEMYDSDNPDGPPPFPAYNRYDPAEKYDTENPDGPPPFPAYNRYDLAGKYDTDNLDGPPPFPAYNRYDRAGKYDTDNPDGPPPLSAYGRYSSSQMFHTKDPSSRPRRPSYSRYDPPEMYRTSIPSAPPRRPPYGRYNPPEKHHTDNPNPPPRLPAYSRCNWREVLNGLAGAVVVILVICLIASVPLGIVFYCFCKAGGSFLFVAHPAFNFSSLRLAVLDVDPMNQLTAMLQINVTARNPNSLDSYNYSKISVAASSGGIPIGEAWLPELVLRAGQTASLSGTATAIARRLNPTSAAKLTKHSTIPVEVNLKMKAQITSWVLRTVWVESEIRCDGIRIAVPKGKVIPPPFFPDVPCEANYRLHIFVDMMKEVVDLIVDVLSRITRRHKKRRPHHSS